MGADKGPKLVTEGIEANGMTCLSWMANMLGTGTHKGLCADASLESSSCRRTLPQMQAAYNILCRRVALEDLYMPVRGVNTLSSG